MQRRKIGSLTSGEEFQQYVSQLDIDLPFADAVEPAPSGPLAEPMPMGGSLVGNRFTILPMEGWDGTEDGRPSELTLRRWRRFGLSGAKLIWGGEAVAVQHDGRANPHQLLISEQTLGGLEELRSTLLTAHRQSFGTTDDLLLGLQLTHSGRFARPNDNRRLEPRMLYRHPVLDAKFHIDGEQPLLSDEEIDRLVDRFVQAAAQSQKLGFDFVDIKHCHGYLGHEFLSSFDRPGKYGGSFENRTRFLRDVVAGIRAAAPELAIGVRLSTVDMIPFEQDDEGVGRPCLCPGPCYGFAFGGDGTGTGFDLSEPHRFMELLKSLDIRLICTSVGSPYYNPHIQRPAWYPPSDGYFPPEDPLLGVARQIAITAKLKAQHPHLVFIGSGYSYLQQWLGHVAQAVVAAGQVDSVGLGRMVLSYPELPADILAGRPLQTKFLCRTFSDCTTAPRHGLVSGCFPLDEHYRQLPQRKELQQVKQRARST